VAAEEADPASMLSLYRTLLRLRRAEPALSVGSIQRIEASDHIFAYQRRHGTSRLQVILNLSGIERKIPDGIEGGELLLSTLGSRPPKGWLRPDEGLILHLLDG
jgi:alpha-glucosidase